MQLIFIFDLGDIRSLQLTKSLDGYMGYQITSQIPGSMAYMRNQKTQAKAIVYNRGSATFFITISANLKGWTDLQDYLKKVWMFRSDLNPQMKPLEDYDVSFTNAFIAQKFRSIRSLFTSKASGMFNSLTCSIV